MITTLLLAAAEAEHHAAAAPPPPTKVEVIPLVTTILVFLIFFSILAAKVWPKITAGLDDRDRKIRKEIESAEQAREQANAALAEYEQSLAEARKEAAAMITKAKADAKTAADDLRKRNEADLTEMKQTATREIEAAKQAAITELHAQASTLAVSIAGKILSREITADDQQRLVEESLRELANINGN